MDQQESAFLAGVFALSDPGLQAQLLAGFHLVRAGCRIADGEDVDGGACVAASRAAAQEGGFEAEQVHVTALRTLEAALLPHARSSAALHRAFSQYAQMLRRDGVNQCAMGVFELTERLWTSDCDPLERLEATFHYAAMVCRGERPLAASRELPLLLAQRARGARSLRHLGLARALRVERMTLSGNLSAALSLAEALLRWARRRRDGSIEQRALLRIAMIHGRLGNFEEVVRFATRSQSTTFGLSDRDATDARDARDAEFLIASALVDLGLLRDAARSYELVLLCSYRVPRQSALVGLMNVAALRQDRTEFDALRVRILRRPLVPALRLIFLRDSAAGFARFGDAPRAAALLEECQTLARSLGFGLDYMQADGDLARLYQAANATAAAPAVEGRLAPELSFLSERHARAAHALGAVGV